MFATVWVKDYEIDLDGKPYTVKGERWLGIVHPENEEKYFEGCSFGLKDNGKYEYEGEVVRSKREFEEMSKRVTFFK